MKRYALTLLFIPALAFSAEQEFLESGNWIVPAGVTEVRIQAWGGGGAGGGRGSNNNASGGGAGGSYAESTVAATPDDEWQISIGGGGVGGTGIGQIGGNSQVLRPVDALAPVVRAVGGYGGAALTTGASGNTIDAIGTILFRGGNGGNGTAGSVGGGGGAGAGSTAIGANGSGGTGGTGANGGGTGGAGGSNANGSPGETFGGGGGGAQRSNGNRVGGNGGQGRVILSWTAGPGEPEEERRIMVIQ